MGPEARDLGLAVPAAAADPADLLDPVAADVRDQAGAADLVQLATYSRLLIIDTRRLAALIDSDPAAAAAWRKMSQQA